MMVPRPYEANLRLKKSVFDFSKFAKKKRNFVSARSRPDSRMSRELNRRPGRPGEGQGGPNKDHLETKIDQNLRTKKYRLVCNTSMEKVATTKTT